jgi:hypothetical protein
MYKGIKIVSDSRHGNGSAGPCVLPQVRLLEISFINIGTLVVLKFTSIVCKFQGAHNVGLRAYENHFIAGDYCRPYVRSAQRSMKRDQTCTA